ncbi:ABC transporter permease [Elioraea sp.]|uniref:ABC transporter permease n=1 Tax=Elioraea sp. TaxID=2185103 RepID=UPI003F70FF53
MREIPAAIEPSERAVPRRSRYLRALLRDPLTLIAVLFLVALGLSALFAELVAPYDPIRQQLAMRNRPPLTPGLRGGVMHLLGTDELGRDLLSRLIFGGRVSLAVGLIGAAAAGVFGTALGLLAGYYRGRVDDVVMRLVDVMAALPTLLIALFFLFIIGGGFWNLVLVLAVVRWRIFARVARSMALSLREQTFILATRAVGATDGRIILRHLLPNMASPLIVLFTLEVAVLILAEAALSFLGFGIQPPASSWGLMIARGREYLTTAWWLVTLPGLAIFLTTLSLNLVAAWVRAVTDPVQRWRWLA